jgi:hypothetical protein
MSNMAEIHTMADAATDRPQSEVNGRNVLFGLIALRRSALMRPRAIGIGIYFLACLCLCRQGLAGTVTLSPMQTQSTSPPGVLTATNVGVGTAGVNNPLVFNQFNPKLGVLDSINITLTTTIRNDYELMFGATPVITTIGVATSETTNPSVLSNPAERALLTDGPTVTLFAPNGVTQLFGAPATRQPVDFVQMTETSGTWSSLLPITNPNFIPPTITEQLFSRSITAADSASLFSDFVGTGKVGLPVTATAFSSYFSSSGNGGGAVITKANAVVTIQYSFEAVPEPSSVLLLGLGIAISALATRVRGRAASSS